MIKKMNLIKSEITKNNNKIEAYKINAYPESNNKTILFIGVFHGEEPQGEFLINKLIEEVKNFTNLKNTLIFIPCLNPDGKKLKTRGNSNGVDLNRNLPTENWELSKEKDDYYSGDSPASEIETKFAIEIINDCKPNLIVTIHAPYKVVNYDGPAQKIAQKISELNNYPVQADIGYPTPGSFGTYTGIERNIPTITLELPDNVDNETLWKDNRKALIYLTNLNRD